MKKEELRKWMNIYHDEWIKSHNKLIDIQRVLDGAKVPLTEEEIEEELLRLQFSLTV